MPGSVGRAARIPQARPLDRLPPDDDVRSSNESVVGGDELALSSVTDATLLSELPVRSTA
ncbi:hypothetical protein D8S78_24355 [Natrialba swarupiae]|nr:hypothetical protein [Natrialba swarupiae]